MAEEQTHVLSNKWRQPPLQECQAVTWEWGFFSNTDEHLNLGVPGYNLDVRLYKSLLEDSAEALSISKSQECGNLHKA